LRNSLKSGSTDLPVDTSENGNSMTSLLFIAVFAVAVVFSMLGLGGGILYIPLLLQAGLDMHTAVPTGLAIMLVMSLTAAVIYHTNSLVDWKLLLIMEPASIIGALIGSYFSSMFPNKVLYVFFAVSMITASAMGSLPQKQILPLAPKSRFPGIFHLKKNNDHYSINLWVAAPVSMLAGFVSSVIGLGGGFLKVPLMTIIFGVPIKIAAATSSAMIVITATSGFLGHAAVGHVDFKLVGMLSIAVFLGALVGTRILVKADKKFLNISLMILQLTIAAWMIYKAVV
jgi:uncharacterized protein